MTNTTNILALPSRRMDSNERRTNSTGRAVPFSLPLDTMFQDGSSAPVDRQKCHGTIHLPTANYCSGADRVEYFLYSLISGAALLSLVLWILSL
jgi:hypothetical protein